MRLAVLLLAALPALAAQFLTLEQILAKAVEALGGAAQVASVTSLKMHGTMQFGKQPPGEITVWARRPNRFRVELAVGKDHVTQGYDGKTGWQGIAGEHPQPAAALAGNALNHLIDQASNAIGGMLVGLKERGNRAELAGREVVGGESCYKLKVTLSTGDVFYIFLDPVKFHDVQEEIPMEIDGKAAWLQESISDFRQFGPIVLPCLFVTREKGGEPSQWLKIESVEVNPAIDESLFRLPR